MRTLRENSQIRQQVFTGVTKAKKEAVSLINEKGYFDVILVDSESCNKIVLDCKLKTKSQQLARLFRILYPKCAHTKIEICTYECVERLLKKLYVFTNSLTDHVKKSDEFYLLKPNDSISNDAQLICL